MCYRVLSVTLLSLALYPASYYRIIKHNTISACDGKMCAAAAQRANHLDAAAVHLYLTVDTVGVRCN
jgi:hypothetical protein